MNATERLSEAFLARRPQEAARYLERMPVEALSAFLAAHDPPASAPVLQSITPGMAAACLALMDGERAQAILSALAFDVQVMVLRVMEAGLRERLLGGLDLAVRESAHRRLRYPQGTAGALMDPLQVIVPSDMTAETALEWVRTARGPSGHYTYVIDRSYRLVGVVTLSELLRAGSETPLQSVMHGGVFRIPATMSQDDVIRSPYWREFRALPVVDGEDRFLGAIRYQTAQALRDEIYRTRNGQGLLGAVLSLGELYWVGLSGMLATDDSAREAKLHDR
jgi:magnesium transporter